MITHYKESITMYLISICTICALFILPCSAAAQADWEVGIRVESGAANNQLTVGADDTATDGYDVLWDTPALLGGEIEAVFPHPEWGLVHQVFHRDIRAHSPGSAIEWTMEVTTTLINPAMTVSWDLSSIPVNYPAVLYDDTAGSQTDMRAASSYTFNYTDTRSFRISITEVPEVDSDGDGVPDSQDNCAQTYNPGQENTNSGTDPYGNRCDCDLDNNGDVGLDDFNLFKAAWLSVPADPNWNPDADFDSSGDVGLDDFNIFKSRWLTSEPWY